MTLKSLYISDRPDYNPRLPANPPSLPSQPMTSATTIEPPLPESSPPYSPSTLTSLAMRYEPPSPFSRWDTPLFTVPSSDHSPPTQAIWTALYPPPTKPTSKKALSQLPKHPQIPTSPSRSEPQNGNGKAEEVKRHAATVLPRATASDALQILESATMDVVKHLLSRARELGMADSGEGGDVDLSIPTTPVVSVPSNPAAPAASSSDSALPGGGSTVETTLSIPPGLVLSQPMLQRLRRKYTQVQRGSIAHGQGYVSGRRSVVEGFVEFLRAEWETDE